MSNATFTATAWINDAEMGSATAATSDEARAVARAQAEAECANPACGFDPDLIQVEVVEDDAILANETECNAAASQLGLGSPHSLLWNAAKEGGLTESWLLGFCEDGNTEDEELEELADALHYAGAIQAEAIARGYIGL